MDKELTTEENEAVEQFIYELGCETAFGDGIQVSRNESVKFLMARKFDVGRAISLFHTNRMLRGKFELHTMQPDVDPLASELRYGKFTVLSGRGPDGQALCIFYARKHFPKLADHVTVLRSIVFQLDYIIHFHEIQKHGLSVIYDMSASAYGNFDFDLAMKVLHLLKGGYPARLKHVYVLAAPIWFRASMTFLSSFLKDKIRDRVQVVKTLAVLYKTIPRQYLPGELGGTCVHDHQEFLEKCKEHFLLHGSSLNLMVVSPSASVDRFPRQEHSTLCIPHSIVNQSTTIQEPLRVSHTPVSDHPEASASGTPDSTLSDQPEASTNVQPAVPASEDGREIFEDSENHEFSDNKEIVSPNAELETKTEDDEPPPPLPPRPPSVPEISAQPSSTVNHSGSTAPTRDLPAEPQPTDRERFGSEESLSDSSSLGPEPMEPLELLAYMEEVGKKGIHREYKELRSLPPAGTFESTMFPVNKEKNRYNNILTFEETRVRLDITDDDPFSDYINANFVNGYEEYRKFICTQGPTPQTFFNFWSMVWEQNVGIIVMVTRCVERNRTKCGAYWPQSMKEKRNFEHLVVEMTKQEVGKDYTITTLNLYNEETHVSRTIIHIQFTSWPDFGVMSTAAPILEVLDKIDGFAEQIQEERRDEPTPNESSQPKEDIEGSGEYATLDAEGELSPVVVHCSAGVGRTGTFCCISNSVERLALTGKIDIYSTVKLIREQRAFSVQTPEQYQFCFTGIIEHVMRMGIKNNEDIGDMPNRWMTFLRSEVSSDSE